MTIAAGMKLVPLVLVPALLARGRWRTSLTAVTGLALSYVPHLVAVGSLVVGFLPLYLQEEGYDSGRRFALFLFLPEAWRAAAAVVTAGSIAVVALFRSRHEPVLTTLCWLYGSSLLIASSIYAWYALPFVVIVLMTGRLEWLSVWVAMYVAFVFDREIAVQAGAYWAALMTVVGISLYRRRLRAIGQDRPSAPVTVTPDRPE